jgi:ribonuclease HI
LAAIVCWWIWIERNQILFEGRPPSYHSVLHRIHTNFNWQPTSQKLILAKAIDFHLLDGTMLICFDGAALQSGLCCGAGGTLKKHQSRTTYWFLNCGSGSNNKEELMGLWVSLSLSFFWSLDHLCILGDLKLIIDWINQSSKLHSVQLEGWKRETRMLANKFTDIQYRHIHRVHNQVADSLSKRALNDVTGRLSVFHCANGIKSPISTYNLFED